MPHDHDHETNGTDAAGEGADGHVHGGRGLRSMARRSRGRLLVVIASGLLVMAVEVVAGLAADSLVLLADAAHYFTDVFAVVIALFAITLAARPATKEKTFGYHRAEVLAAFVNALALWGISVYFVIEAYRRLRSPPEVAGMVVLLVGAFSLVANLGQAALLRGAAGENINIRAAYLHVLSDALGSAAALLAGILVHFYGLNIADPVLTLVITALIVAFTWRLTRETLHILLEGTPSHLDVDELSKTLRSIPAVQDLHDLHVWSLTSGIESMSAHIVLDPSAEGEAVMQEIRSVLRERFNIDHVTVQLETPDFPCGTIRCDWPAS